MLMPAEPSLAVAAAEAKPPAGMPERLAICAMDCDTLKRPVLLSVSFSPAELMPPDGYAARGYICGPRGR